MFVRAYLRASTSEQDANRAKDQLRSFAAERGLTIAACYIENESGAKLARPAWRCGVARDHSFVELRA